MHSTPLIVVLGAILATACAQLESADPVVANHTSVVSGNRPTVHTVDPSEVKFESLQVANVTHNASEPANSDDCASDIGCDVTSIIQSLDRRSFVSAAKKHCLENRYIVFHIATNGERISLETTCPTHSNRGTEIDGAAFLDVLDLLKEPYYEAHDDAPKTFFGEARQHCRHYGHLAHRIENKDVIIDVDITCLKSE